jgi:hypothetical protein
MRWFPVTVTLRTVLFMVEKKQYYKYRIMSDGCFIITKHLTLGPTQPSIHWVPRALYPEVKAGV